MTRRVSIVAAGLCGALWLSAAAVALADEVNVDVSCRYPATHPQAGAIVETARRNSSLSVVVTFENRSTLADITVTRGALGYYLGGVTLVGPLAFTPPATVIPRATFGTKPCPTCPAPLNPGTVQVPMTNIVRIPPQARPQTFITIGLGFFGRHSSDPLGTRRDLGAEACVIEIVP